MSRFARSCEIYDLRVLRKIPKIARATIFGVHLQFLAALCLVNDKNPKQACGFYKNCEKKIDDFSSSLAIFRTVLTAILLSFVLLISSDTTGSMDIRRNNEASGTHIPFSLTT